MPSPISAELHPVEWSQVDHSGLVSARRNSHSRICTRRVTNAGYIFIFAPQRSLGIAQRQMRAAAPASP